MSASHCGYCEIGDSTGDQQAIGTICEEIVGIGACWYKSRIVPYAYSETKHVGSAAREAVDDIAGKILHGTLKLYN